MAQPRETNACPVQSSTARACSDQCLCHGLSPRQRDVLRAIEDHIREECVPPTLRELGKRLGIGSTNAVDGHLYALQRKGFITRIRGKSRGIRIIKREETGQ